ncbi:YciK family oxidoreductase [Paraglaciecola arctica]|uniref:Short chain dehydrogenase n=1 Tax=Paraglaciecola arctica BSs20135 TaxID=493475 RepID=K6YGU4_9ALTE|nr:YciK family oxidoreductase [Paraglaciecola arctica]GAC17372.1 short chain dehydrogenase [Paraglaciecola arctica BSs20135]
MHTYTPQKDYLKNKTMLVTGAGDGIGKQAALHFAKYGATVILLGKTVAKLESVYDEIINNGGNEPAIVPLDLKGATAKHYRDMANTISDQFGCLDGLLHNASMLGHLGPFTQISEQDWQDVFQVNVTSQFLMTQALLPILKKAPHCSVIFTTSGVGLKGRAYWGPYSISKFATQGMMQILADEYENSNIRFNCINPGATKTAMRAKAFPAENVENLKTPEEIMPLYLYLMDDKTSSENGQTFEAQPK